jgi:crotonobetainyl-CoA:carnitine CoA-transferase CaiB-like acyl-CoA transferase
MILAQLGADVVAVEPPRGDDSRHYASQIDEVSVVYRYVGAGKRSVVVDLKSDQGREVALALIERADVVLQSMRPGVADRLGIGYDAARERSPSVLYYDVNAFGTGPTGRGLPGYDPLVQAFSGIIEMNGHDDGPPTRCAPSVVDLGTGQWIALGVMAALLARGRGDEVGRLETALVDTAFSLVPYQATSARVSGVRPPKAGSGNPIAAPYQCYRARDGHVLIAAANQRLWEAAATALGVPELITDERFRDQACRVRYAAELETAINEVLGTAEVDEWLTRLRAANVPAGKVLGLEEAVDTEVAQERGTFQLCDRVPLVRLPVLADGAPLDWRRPAPRLGAHTVEVLEELGYGAEQITSLLGSGAVAGADELTKELA